jgi:hypothetical protein
VGGGAVAVLLPLPIGKHAFIFFLDLCVDKEKVMRMASEARYSRKNAVFAGNSPLFPRNYFEGIKHPN